MPGIRLSAVRPRRTVGNWLVRLLGIDAHIFVTLLFRGWATMAGGVMVVLVPLWLTKTEQGYYYTLLSLLAVQIFFELGLNQIIVQLVSHECATLDDMPDGGFAGDGIAIERLTGLVRVIGRWYLFAALLFAVLAGTGGAIFFTHRVAPTPGYVVPLWLGLVAINAGNLYLSPSLAVLEGCGRVDRVARIRLIQSIVGYLAMWAGFAAGAGLWAVLGPSAAALVITAFYVKVQSRRLAWLRRQSPAAISPIDWRRDILPLQWRIALSWVSGYFIMQIFVPMTFAHQGPVEAGRLGITLTVFAALQTLGMSWMMAKSPALTALIARGDHFNLRQLFKATAARSLVFVTGGSIAALIALELLGPATRGRFAATSTVVCIALSTVATNMIFAAATFMRAHREEPMVALSLATALLMIPTVYFGSEEGTTLMMAIYLVINLVVGLPWTALLLRGFWRRHSK